MTTDNPMQRFLLQVLFGQWLRMLNAGKYEELRMDLAKAITALEQDAQPAYEESKDVYSCGCEYKTDRGETRVFTVRCPTCNALGERT